MDVTEVRMEPITQATVAENVKWFHDNDTYVVSVAATDASACSSMGSPRGVPVPCAST